MGAALERFAAAGVRFDLLDGGKVRAHGELTDELREAIRAQKPAIIAELATNEPTHHVWRVAIAGRDPFTVYVVPDATEGQMRAQYPGATIESLANPPPRRATPAEETELRALINSVADRDGWPGADREEAIAVAFADPADALACWRALVAGAPCAGQRRSQIDPFQKFACDRIA
jgi:hypothetical protein